jgi:hypothetical protein
LAVAQQIIGALLRPPLHLGSGNDDPAIGKTFLLAYLFVTPAWITSTSAAGRIEASLASGRSNE